MITLLFCLFMVSCSIEPEEIVLKEEPEIPVITEEIIMSDFSVKPITEYPAYFATNTVFGIQKTAKGADSLTGIKPVIEIEGKESESVFDTFFKIGGKIYFTVTQNFPPETVGGEPEVITKYCVQENNIVKYLTKDKFPIKPEETRAIGEAGKYSVFIDKYNGQTISLAKRDYDEKMIFIEGFFLLDGGLLLSVKEGRGAERPAGLLFWADGKRNMDKWKDIGRLWK